MNFSMWRGQTKRLTFGPVLVDGVQPAGALSICQLFVADADLQLLFNIVGTVDNATTWEGSFTITPADTAALTAEALLGGGLLYYTIKLVGGGNIYVLPTDDAGEPDIGIITFYETAHA